MPILLETFWGCRNFRAVSIWCRPRFPQTAVVALLASLSMLATVDGQTASETKSMESIASQKALEQLALIQANSPAPSSETKGLFETPLTQADAARAAEMLWNDFRRRLLTHRRAEFEAKQIIRGDLKMPFEYQIFGDAPAGGRSLFISLHGGGEMTAEVNDKQWRNQIRLYQPDEGVYVAPRAPTNSWNMWHQSHIDEFFSTLIENFVLFEKVNPNRVYLMGYSAGGDGVYQLAPRMADRLAAAAMMAGHPNESEPLNLRNLGFAIHVGELDAAFNRNEIARQWGKRLDQLREDDPDGYPHLVKLHAGKGHWMDREDAEALKWLAEFERKPLPRRVVWRQDDVTHDRFYWLAVPPDSANAGTLVIAQINGQQIDVESSDVTALIVRVHDEMVDMDQAITIRLNGATVFQGLIPRTLAAMEHSLTERADPSNIFSGEVQIGAR